MIKPLGSPGDDAGKSSTVNLDARISAAQLPPPPFKSLVKGTALTRAASCQGCYPA